MDAETWTCLDCYHQGHLTVHGACERCGSHAVVVPYEVPSAKPEEGIFGMGFRTVGDELRDGVVHHWWSFRFYIKTDQDPDKRVFGQNEDLSE